MDDWEAEQQEEILRRELRGLGLGWLLEQVDAALVNEAAELEDPPDARRRLEVIVEAVAFAVEVTEAAEGSLFALLGGQPIPGTDTPHTADRPPEVYGIRFVDPIARETSREVARDRRDRVVRARAVRDAAERLKGELRY